MIVSYDIDGVLAEKPPASEVKWGKMKKEERDARRHFLCYWYKNASPLLIPKEDKFYAISARKNDMETAGATKMWLNKYYNTRVLGLCLLSESRTIENVVKFKSKMVSSLNIKRHYEDNKKVLKGMRAILPASIELFFWEKQMEKPVLFFS